MSNEPTVVEVRNATWQQVLAEQPPYKKFRVNVEQMNDNRVRMPEVLLHCPECDGVTKFEPRTTFYPGGNAKLLPLQWVWYGCKQCEATQYGFGLLVELVDAERDVDWFITKVGQFPQHGPRVPARLVTLIEPEREQFLKGRRCEAQGLAIGAYGYYRRVVESQRNRLLDAIIKAAERTNAAPEKVEQLKRARADNRFKESMALAEEALPDSLFINGHNPLKVLHNALSEGLHTLTDEQCLARAEAARVVLSALAERLAEVSKEEADLAAALHKLTTKGGAQS